MINAEAKQTELILVGGFLGAGKTTLLRQAALHLMSQGLRIGLITNDQASDLVDTAILRQAGFGVEEITGGCFCCRFSDLIAASDQLVAASRADVLIGEPVGSCTDISATVLQPIKDLFAAQYRLAPFTVLVDPMHLEAVLDPRMKSPLHPSARYILRKQLEEADLIAINKIDLLDAVDLAGLLARTREMFADKPQVALSALTGDGLKAWFQLLGHGRLAGSCIVDVDYDIYAEGEAVLGWLNATVLLHSPQPAEWAHWLEALLQAIRLEIARQAGKVVHIKALLTDADGWLSANLTSGSETPAMLGALTSNPQDVRLALNARVEMTPGDLESAVLRCLRAAMEPLMTWKISHLQCLSPGRPEPTHRYARVVGPTP